MKTLKNIILSTVLAGSTIIGANAQTSGKSEAIAIDMRTPGMLADSTKLITVSEPDTTILQPYFLIKDLTLSENTADKSYRIDMNKKALYPDTENKFIPYASFEVFKQDLKNGLIKPSQIPGQTIDDIALMDIDNNNNLYKVELNSKGKCPNDCDINPELKDLLQYVSSLVNKYSTVCTNLSTKELTSLNGIITAEETHVANEKARKFLAQEQYAGKSGVTLGLVQSNPGHSYMTKAGVRAYSKPEKRGLVVTIMPPVGTVGDFKESEFIIEDDFKKEVVPCDGPDCDDTGKSKKSKSEKIKNDSKGIYLGASLGKNSTLDLVVPNVALGVNIGNFSIGLNGGYSKGNNDNSTTFPGVNGGFTRVDSTRNTTLTQIGGELSYKLFDGKLILYAGAQQNIALTQNGGSAFQRVIDGAGNTRDQTILLNSSNDTQKYLTVNPGVGVKLSKNLDLIVQTKYNTQSKKFDEYNAGLRFNFYNKKN